MFKRRKKRTYAQTFAEGIYPRGGWTRAVSYAFHRIRRLPDPPHKISRGIAIGVFVCFTPFYGMHFLLATILAFIIQGNVFAALMATFFGNPVTFPIIAVLAVDLGSWMLGLPGGMLLPGIVGAFSHASVELWVNFSAVFTGKVAHWDSLIGFFNRVFLPYLVGGVIPGIITATVAYAISHPLISAYQKARIKRLKKRYQKRRKAQAEKADVVSEIKSL